ncbi:MAG: rhodanese-like domain-containing protein [Gammaproteobacteria bacterium]|nr:rhodanese-like domain-containing protein [Gammaproteobacteria bacterium]
MEKIIEFVANHPFLIALWVAIALLLLWNLLGDSLGGIKALNTAEVIRLINHEDALLVDLRSKADFDKGHILGAENIPAATLDEQIDKLKNRAGDRPVVLYCGNGMESQRSGRKQQQAGLEKLYLLKGGLPAWREANLPVTKE